MTETARTSEGAPTPPPRSRARDIAMLIAFVAVCFGAAALGNLFSGGRMDGWYEALRKPAFTPPGWIFGPVWTLLYACMGIAAWLVWQRRGFRRAALPLGLFAAQLAMNAAWTPLFFGLRSPAAAMVDLAALWVLIALTTARFFPISRLAGWLMAPYLAWTTFAAALNLAIWRLNA